MKEFENIFLEKSIAEINQIPKKTLPEIAISGKSNVGKSSLINSIISKKIAYTSKNAGKTVLINFYKAKNFRIIDIPGYGFSSRSQQEKTRFNKLADNYFRIKRPDCVLQLIDSRHDLQNNDKQMIKFLSEFKLKFYLIFTKIDKLSSSQYEHFCLNLKKQIDIISPSYSGIIPVSSKNNLNINKIRILIISELKRLRDSR